MSVTANQSRSILVVDDDEAVTQTFAQMLRTEGFTVRTASDAESGLTQAAENRPDAIILDLRMPRVDGLSFLKRLRASEEHRLTPVAIVTGDYSLDEHLSAELRQLGARVEVQAPLDRGPDQPGSLSPQGDTLNREDLRFIRACRRQPVDRTPVWFMRQAGRYMSVYRELRQRYSLLDLCRIPDLATEVTMQPVRAIEVDAAILFSDLLLPLEPMGIRFDFIKGEGPQIENPIAGDDDIARLRPFESRDSLSHVLQAIRQIQTELGGRIPLIGFAGAPFTLASYAIEGGHSNNFAKTKALMYGHPDSWHKLCGLFAEMIGEYLVAQVEAGVDVVQVFDSWVGALNAADYREFILPHTRRIFEIVSAKSSVPTIHFGVGTWSILAEMREAGGDVIGADWRTPLDEAWDRIGHDRAIQGNLDPTLLLGPLDRVLAGVDDVLARAGGRPGHIFNLGHGILPPTPLEHVQAVARYVHQQTRR